MTHNRFCVCGAMDCLDASIANKSLNQAWGRPGKGMAANGLGAVPQRVDLSFESIFITSLKPL